jgi:hypothetical protein
MLRVGGLEDRLALALPPTRPEMWDTMALLVVVLVWGAWHYRGITDITVTVYSIPN